MVKIGALAALLSIGMTGAAFAGDASGVWLRSNGAARVKFSPCGGALCGSIVWLKDSNTAGHVGERVFFDMKKSGENTWDGAAFNPEDGKTYSGGMVMSGNSLVTSGCVLGGLICKRVTWTRVD